MPTIAAVSDIHLGSATSPGAQILIDAASSPSDILVVAGDLFDRSDPTLTHLDEAVDALRDAARRVPVLLIWGNHDAAVSASLPPIDNVTVVPSCAPALVTVGGIDFVACSVATDPADYSVSYPRVPGAIGVLHTSLTGEHSKKPCLPCSVEDLLACDYRAWILGHVHEPIWVHEKPPIFWPGQGEIVRLEFY